MMALSHYIHEAGSVVLMDAVGDLVVGRVASDIRCIGCGRSLRGRRIIGYQHSGGEVVNGVKMWLYVQCPSCGYQNSLRKLGVSLIDVLG